MKVDANLAELFGDPDTFDFEALIAQMELLHSNVSGLLGKGSITSRVELPNNGSYMNDEPLPNEEVMGLLSKYFGDCVNWKSPRTMFNVTPPVIGGTIASSAISGYLNQTLVSDMACGGFAKLEMDVIRIISNLVGWDDQSSGIFTFGGTATNMYGVKIGLNKADRDISQNGVQNIITIDSDQAHSSHKTITDWLGIGLRNNVILRAGRNGELDSNELIGSLEEIIKSGKKIGCVTLSGGTTYDHAIDPIGRVKEGIDRLVQKHSLDYIPHLHVDSVIGWPYLFFGDYNFDQNPLGFAERTLTKLRTAREKIGELKYSDSFGVDFHKTGFCPYASSLFMLKNKEDWAVIGKGHENAHHQAFQLGSYSPGKYTLETSRSTNGPVSAYFALKVLGVKGFQKLIGHYIEIAEYIRERLEENAEFEVCNPQSIGWCTMFLLNTGRTYDFLLNNASSREVADNNKQQKDFHRYLDSFCSDQEG